jgi:hypothetical protein
MIRNGASWHSPLLAVLLVFFRLSLCLRASVAILQLPFAAFGVYPDKVGALCGKKTPRHKL